MSERRNIVVIADEAHRLQYDLLDGFARRLWDMLPHASFIGSTGTPIEKADANTRAVFGDPKRIGLIAADLVAHFEKRTEAMNGKAMARRTGDRRLNLRGVSAPTAPHRPAQGNALGSWFLWIPAL